MSEKEKDVKNSGIGSEYRHTVGCRSMYNVPFLNESYRLTAQGKSFSPHNTVYKDY